MIFRLGELFYGTGVLAHGKARRRMVGFVMRNACANRGTRASSVIIGKCKGKSHEQVKYRFL